MTCETCGSIELGDVVEHRMNTNVFGIVIGFMGSIVIIRVSPSLQTMYFHEWELDPVDDDDYGDPLEAVPDDDTNVVDFTTAVKLRRNTTTRGAA